MSNYLRYWAKTTKREAILPRPAWTDARVRCFVRVLAVAFAFMILGTQSQAESPPICPSHETEPYPPYGELRKPPNTAIWREVGQDSGADCEDLFQEPMALVVALAGRFRHTGSVEDIASRIGAVSWTEELPYWSTTEQKWRVLVSEAFALNEPDANTTRPDFTADEVLSGRTLYFAQNDTRSTGLNIYGITVNSADRDHLSFEIINITPIKFSFLTLFEPGTLLSVHFVERKNRAVWSYYGISLVKSGAVDGHEKSFINRGAAFYRFLIGQPADQNPPLAP